MFARRAASAVGGALVGVGACVAVGASGVVVDVACVACAVVGALLANV